MALTQQKGQIQFQKQLWEGITIWPWDHSPHVLSDLQTDPQGVRSQSICEGGFYHRVMFPSSCFICFLCTVGGPTFVNLTLIFIKFLHLSLGTVVELCLLYCRETDLFVTFIASISHSCYFIMIGFVYKMTLLMDV